MINYGQVLMSKLFHDALDLLLSTDLNLVLFIKLVHPLCEYLEHRLVSFAFRVYKLYIVDWRLLEPLNHISIFFIMFFERIVDINSCLQTSLPQG